MKIPVIKTDDAPVRTIGVATLGITLVIFGAWGANAPIDSAAVAPGVIEVETDRSTVQHLDGGIIAAVHVAEGDLVRAGQVLIELDGTQEKARLEAVRGRLVTDLAREARLLAERADTCAITFPSFAATGIAPSDERVKGAVVAQRELCEARRTTLQGQLALLDERIEQLSNKREGLARQREINLRRVVTYQEELGRLRKLAQRGHATLSPIFALERDQAEVEAMVAGLVTEIATTRLTAGEARLQALQLKRRFEESVVNELSQLQGELPQIAEELRALTVTVDRTAVRAPSSGKVLGLSLTTIGGVAGAGEPLLDIVPQNAPLIVEAKISPLDIDRVYRGLSAKINLPAFKSAVTPSVEGVLTEVSADSLVDEVTGQPYFQARIELTGDAVSELELKPGMPADAMIRTGENTLLAYLAQPLTDALAKSFVED
ncbi:MAG: HlyD family type I secretion periplasmic adaptor subunit [Pseudomonadota bacterium]